MDTQFFKNRLIKNGFEIEAIVPESGHEDYNTVISSTRAAGWITREELLKNEIFNR
jgi:hypothetical protein